MCASARVEDGAESPPENSSVGWWDGLTPASSQAKVS